MLAINPKHQKKGLVTKLMNFCAAIADDAGLSIYLGSLASAHDMYLRLGYKDLDLYDMNLYEYGKKLCGYGPYRT
jgi:predicted N-acetyltransferase YhbS